MLKSKVLDFEFIKFEETALMTQNPKTLDYIMAFSFS